MDASIGNKIGRVVIMGLLIVVILGHLFLWVIVPTNVYMDKWQRQIKTDTSSTFFGSQGTNILLFTFPVLFIAVLASVYLHLGKINISSNFRSNKREHEKLAIWKKPMIVKGLGIVTRNELAFFVMFLVLLIWTFSNYLWAELNEITPLSAAEDGEKMWEAKLYSVALSLGLAGKMVLAFLFYPVTRGSTVLRLFGLTSEASIKYHMWLGHIVMTIFTTHGVCFIIYWVSTHQLSKMLKWEKMDISHVPGELALLFGVALWAATLPHIRRKMFELFLYMHHLYILFIVFFVLHVRISYAFIVLPGFYIFMVDRFLRFLQSRNRVRLVSARILPCETLELNLAKTKELNYTPMSIMFINVPNISKLQWHPFSVTSSSSLEPENISIVVKGEGSWTKKLYQMVSSPSSVDHLDVAVEGPYGPVSTDFLRHDTLVMVSGGSGITPFISIIRELIFLNQSQKLKTPKIILITAFRSLPDLAMLDLLLPISTITSQITTLNIKIEAYITRGNKPINKSENPIKTKYFKPDPKAQPISPILGPNSWLWLGLIISLSFVILLLFTGILTRYYIYPIDHNTNQKYPASSRAALYMLLICISIAITASAIFYWNKKGTQRENNKANIQLETLVASPGSLFCNMNVELESLPRESIIQNTTVHYGERPDLRGILSELKEPSVGVFAAGPKKLRHEVAHICSSALMNNLQFESISFSW